MNWDKIDPQDTNVIMHVYRGEVQRINTWRQRMDRTTNWAIVITVGVITFIFSNVGVPHWAVFPGLVLSYVLLFTEARRYRHYDAWRGRVRVLEEVFLAKFFDKDAEISEEWTRILADDFHDPKYKIGQLEALRTRLLRIYLWIIMIFLGAWVTKIYIHPTRARSFHQFFYRVSGPLGTVAGMVIFFTVTGVIIGSTLFIIMGANEGMAKQTGEKEIHHEFATDEYIEEFRETKDVDPDSDETGA
jgi:uncharacterized membrane protein